jgi:small membrane protein
VASIIIASLIIIAVYVGTKRLSGLQTSAVIAVTLIGIVLAVFPGLSTQVASFLHVGRGTDLILYLAVLAGLFVASNFYFRFKRQEAILIALARQSAIDHAHAAPTGAAAPSVANGDRTVEQVEDDLHRIEP